MKHTVGKSRCGVYSALGRGGEALVSSCSFQKGHLVSFTCFRPNDFFKLPETSFELLLHLYLFILCIHVQATVFCGS